MLRNHSFRTEICSRLISFLFILGLRSSFSSFLSMDGNWELRGSFIDCSGTWDKRETDVYSRHHVTLCVAAAANLEEMIVRSLSSEILCSYQLTVP